MHRDFHTCLSPENYLVRELETVKTDTCDQRYILLGASNLGCCSACLRNLGKSVDDLTVPGWIASPENIQALMET
jgi:hypothetical protein